MPTVREVFFPASDTEIIDTWDSTGLRGTASHDYAVTDLFVPESRTMWFQEPPTCARPLYQMPPIGMFATFIGAVPLGIARHAVDAFAALATAKTPTLSQGVLADKSSAQAILGRAHALVRAGRAYLIDKSRTGTRPHWPTAASCGSPPPTSPTIRSTPSTCSTPQPAPVRCTRPVPSTGACRDARTAVQHIVTQEANFELAGRQLLGRAEAVTAWHLDYRGER